MFRNVGSKLHHSIEAGSDDVRTQRKGIVRWARQTRVSKALRLSRVSWGLSKTEGQGPILKPLASIREYEEGDIFWHRYNGFEQFWMCTAGDDKVRFRPRLVWKKIDPTTERDVTWPGEKYPLTLRFGDGVEPSWILATSAQTNRTRLRKAGD